jgi:hypothetical protein
MDLDCTFYFWRRKLASVCLGVVVTVGLAFALDSGTKESITMCWVYGGLVGLFFGNGLNQLMQESYCADDNNCWRKLGLINDSRVGFV